MATLINLLPLRFEGPSAKSHHLCLAHIHLQPVKSIHAALRATKASLSALATSLVYILAVRRAGFLKMVVMNCQLTHGSHLSLASLWQQVWPPSIWTLIAWRSWRSKLRGCERVDILKRDNAKYLRLPKAGQKRTAHPSGTQTEHKTAHEIRCLVMRRLDYKRAYSTSGLYTTLPSISSPIQSEGSTSKLYTNGRWFILTLSRIHGGQRGMSTNHKQHYF